ncbi:hypothetical protein AB0L05_19690 [Nonomuraea pusilla]|uniref:hypothetical protein n=1 Tax=Nonomuraea pusilla TaxID=46177 RepID=UPI003332E7B7
MSEQTLPLPGALRAARSIMCVQLILMALPFVIMLGFMQPATVGVLLLALLPPAVMGVALGLAVVKMRSRQPWVRWTALAAQTVMAAGQAIGLVSDPRVPGLVGLALALSAIGCLLSATSAAWFKPAVPEGTAP